MSYQTLEALERRKRVVRIILFLIILSTTPFYCAGFLLWGTARPAGSENSTILATNTPIGGNLTATRQPTLTPLPLTITVAAPLQPTPLQFIPINPGTGGGGGTIPTQIFVQPTIFIPTSTLAPTLTPFPTNPPPATATPLPTDPPLPTNTPEPLPTEAPPPTVEPLPTDPPLPTEAPVVEAPPADTGTSP
jgi:type VI secretion system secreted protein VgrG